MKDAVVIMLAVPDAGSPGKWMVKLRRGLAAQRGFSLQALKIEDWDTNYGARANAGSNKRNGGTTIPPGEYATKLRERLRELLNPSTP